MRVYIVNSFGNLSTGRIATDIAKILLKEGDEARVAYARGSITPEVQNFKIGSTFDLYLHGILARLTDGAGYYSDRATKELIEDIKKFKPDIIHLHNLHGYYLNFVKLFEYLYNARIPIVWTLHDCWSVTGHCCHFTMIGCEKWKTGCNNCINLAAYPSSFWDNTKKNYRIKQKYFSGRDIHFVTVSKWLQNIIKESYLKYDDVRTIYNGVDLNIFKPTDSNLREKYDIKNKRIILGVASTWAPNKGLEDFIKLSGLLTEEYKIVLIGLSSKQIKKLPENILGLSRTKTIDELVEWYSTADIFFNASVEETFGLPTIEAMACGTPVIVYNSTALPEIVEEGCGSVVHPHDFKNLIRSIDNIVSKEKRCDFLRSVAAKYDKYEQYQKYISLYHEIMNEESLDT